MDVEAQIIELDSRVSALEKASKAQDRHNARVTELLTELKEDVALLRRHAISSGQKIEEIDARLGSLEGRMERVEHRLDGIERRLDGVEHRLTNIETYLRRDLPGIIAETMREVLRQAK